MATETETWTLNVDGNAEEALAEITERLQKNQEELASTTAAYDKMGKEMKALSARFEKLSTSSKRSDRIRRSANRSLEKMASAANKTEKAFLGLSFGGGEMVSQFKLLDDGFDDVKAGAGGLEDSLSMMYDVLWPLRTLVISTVLPVALLGAAFTAAAAKGISDFVTKTKAGEAASKKLAKGMDTVSASLGGAILGFEKGSTLLDAFGGQGEKWAKIFRKELAPSIFRFSKALMKSVVNISFGVATATLGAFQALMDGTSTMSQEVIGTLRSLMGGFVKYMDFLENLANATGNSHIFVGLGGPQARKALQDGLNDFESARQRIVEGTTGASAQIAASQLEINERLNKATLGSFKGLLKTGSAATKDAAKANYEWQMALLQGVADAREGENERIAKNAEAQAKSREDQKKAEERMWADLEKSSRAFNDKKKADAEAQAAAWTQVWTNATSQITSGLLNIGMAAAEMGIAIARGTASLGDLGRMFLTQMGSLFEQLGTGLMLSGAGLGALFEGNAAGAVALGAGLAVVGAVMKGFGAVGKDKQADKGGTGGSDSARQLFKEFAAKDKQADANKQPIIVQIGTRKIYESITDGQRRGLIGSNA